jgi:hypothetical protein
MAPMVANCHNNTTLLIAIQACHCWLQVTDRAEVFEFVHM